MNTLSKSNNNNTKLYFKLGSNINNNNNNQININFNNIKTICGNNMNIETGKFTLAEYTKVKDRLIDGKAS